MTTNRFGQIIKVKIYTQSCKDGWMGSQCPAAITSNHIQHENKIIKVHVWGHLKCKGKKMKCSVWNSDKSF